MCIKLPASQVAEMTCDRIRKELTKDRRNTTGLVMFARLIYAIHVIHTLSDICNCSANAH